MDFAEWKDSLTDEQKSAIDKYVDNSDKHGIIKRKRVSIDNMRNEKPLTKSQIEETIDYAVRLGMPRELIRYSDAYYTSYGCNFDILCIGTDVYPTELKRKKANSRVSNKGAIAHEIVGHRETVLKGWAQADEVLDEIQASIRAARFAPELTKVERITLLRDAVERARDNGIVLKNIKDKLYINER